MGRMTLITGGERRRRWSDEDRARILAAVEESWPQMSEQISANDKWRPAGVDVFAA